MAGSGMSSDKRGHYGARTFGGVNGCMFDELEKQSAHVRMTRKPADRIALSLFPVTVFSVIRTNPLKNIGKSVFY